MSLQSLEWREVGMSISWPVVSYWPQQYLCHQNTNIDSLTTLVPLNWTFYPWSNRDGPENVWRIVQSFLFTQPRGVSAVCHWAGSRQVTLCSASSISLLSRVCSSRVVVPHQAPSAHMTIQRGVLFAGAMRKSQFWWRTYEHPVCWFFIRYEGTSSATWCSLHMVPPPTSPSLFSSPCRHQL